MADVQRTSWIAIRSGRLRRTTVSHALTYPHARTYNTLVFSKFLSPFPAAARCSSSPYLQQHFYFVSEHGLNRQRVRNKRFREEQSPREGWPRAHRQSAQEARVRGGLRTVCLQVVSPREAYNRYMRDTKYRTREGDDGGATKGRERKRDDLEGVRRFDFIGHCLTAIKARFRPEDSRLHLSPSASRSIIVACGLTSHSAT